MSPAESMLQLINTDFAAEEDDVTRLDPLVEAWKASPEKRQLDENIECGNNDDEPFTMPGLTLKGYPRNLAMQTFVQLHRMGLVNYSRRVF